MNDKAQLIKELYELYLKHANSIFIEVIRTAIQQIENEVNINSTAPNNKCKTDVVGEVEEIMKQFNQACNIEK